MWVDEADAGIYSSEITDTGVGDVVAADTVDDDNP